MTASDAHPAGRPSSAVDREKLILDTLCQDFQSFFYLDFEQKMVSVTKSNDETVLFLDNGRTSGDFDVYRAKLRECFDRYVDQESAPDFVQALDPERLQSRLLRERKLVYRFCAVTNSGRRRHLEVFAALTDDDAGGVVGFRVIDKIVAEEKRKHMLLDEQTRVISALSQEYTTVWLVSGMGEEITKYRDSGRDNVAREDAYFSTQNISYDDVLERYLRIYVCDEYKEEFARKVRYDVVRREIRRQPVYSVIFKRDYRGVHEYFQISFTAAGDADGTDFVVGFKNVNELVREERQRNELLAEALSEAECANRAKTQFFNNMSHDIRTPMNAIVGFTSLALSHLNDREKVEGYLKKISTSSEHLLSLINDVLDMSRIESGRVSIEEKSLDLSELLSSIATIIQPVAEAKKLRFLVDVADVAGVRVVSDKLRLTQILLNLLSNGVKFTESGGELRLRVRQETGAPEGYVRYRFVVADTGIGISKEFQNHIFESFSREQTAQVGGIQGTGLGLAITKKVVDMMGGTIRLESEEGRGSEFDVRLTFRLAAEPAASGGEAALPDRARKAFAPEGKTILLVEDNELNQEIAVAILEEAGFRVEVASDGSVAVEKMGGADAGRFDAILMDVRMPVMDGYEATRRIRAMEAPACKGIPIIAMTANAFEEDRRAAIAAGMNGHLSKPIDVKLLMETLSEVM